VWSPFPLLFIPLWKVLFLSVIISLFLSASYCWILSTSVYLKQSLFYLWGVDYEKPMRTWRKHSCAQWSTGWVWHGPSHRREWEAKCSTDAFPKLFTFREVESRFLLLQCHTPLWDCCSTSLFTTGYKKLAEGGHKVFLMEEGFWWGFWLAATDAGSCVSLPEQPSAWRTLYIGFRKAKLKES
jgi:hypothetical protein